MPGLSDDDRRVLEALTRSIVNRLLHDPTVFLKNQATKSELDAARLLFGLWGDDVPAGPMR
jgi:glutamyl-tRNA reductase